MREINYLRIAVTDKCNLRCTYCMPEEGVCLKKHEEILSLEEIEKLVRVVGPMGIKHIRLTGGEPLVRKNIIGLIKKIRSVLEIESITMTTNGILLPEMAEELKKAGLDRVNISLDSLRGDKFKEITRGGDLETVLKGVDEALRVGLTPVKINVVAMKGFNDDEILDFAYFARDKGVHVRFIELMPIGESDGSEAISALSIESIKKIVGEELDIIPTEDVLTNGPAENYRIKDGQGSIGFIGALSNHFCERCNRLRITADGKVRLCLHKDLEYDLRAILKEGSDKEIVDFFQELIVLKPEKHTMEEDGWGTQQRSMSQIGG